MFFKEMNNPVYRVEDSTLYMNSNTKTDFIKSAVSKSKVSTAAYLFQEVTGDFTIKAKVSHEFLGVYDACGMMAYEDNDLWAKCAFELTNFGTHTIVSVITNKTSDDANGVNLEGNEVWLQLARKGDTFAIHYGIEENKLFKVRVFSLPMKQTIKVGFVTQSPNAEGSEMKFEHFSLVNKAPENIRTGI